jgi:hypothetical protein
LPRTDRRRQKNVAKQDQPAGEYPVSLKADSRFQHWDDSQSCGSPADAGGSSDA